MVILFYAASALWFVGIAVARPLLAHRAEVQQLETRLKEATTALEEERAARLQASVPAGPGFADLAFHAA